MKTKITFMSNILLLFFFVLCITDIAWTGGHPTTIYTPKGTSVPAAYILDEMGAEEIVYFDNVYRNAYQNAIFISSSSSTYNCHGYAWYMSEGGSNVFIGLGTDTAEDIYWKDGSYIEAHNEFPGEKVSYVNDNHSAVTTSTPGWFISKWSEGPLMKHASNDCPFNSSSLKYYVKYDTKVNVTANQVFENGNRVQQGVSVSQVGHWETNTFASYTVPKVFVFNVGNETMRANTNTWTNSQTGNIEKYRTWNNSNDVVNHKKFEIQIGTIGLTSQFLHTNNATVQSQLVEGGNPTGGVNFKDPWLIDYADPSYRNNLRNQGMSAPFKSVAYSANNLGTGTSYKGVFLNQGGPDIHNLIPPYYSIRAPQTVNFGGAIGMRNVYLQSWRALPASSASFQDSLTSQTAVVFKSAGIVVSANIKGSMLSNISSSFTNNSQRKLVRTPGNGWLHQVYESSINGVSHVWYEMSTNSGTTWALMSPVNGGGTPGPLDIGGGKCPSIDLSPDGTSIVIAFQQASGNYYTIIVMTYIFYNGQWMEYSKFPIWTEPQGGDLYSITNANPNISWAGDNNAILTWERKSSVTWGGVNILPGINYITGKMSITGLYNYYAYPSIISGTNANSINTSISTIYFPSPYFYSDFAVAWQQYVNSGSSSIKYCYFVPDANGKLNQYIPTPNNVSTSLYSSNHNPSIVILPDASVRVCWIGDNGNGDWMTTNSLERDPSSSTIYQKGAGVKSVSMNRMNNTSNYCYAWSQNINGSRSNNAVSSSNLLQSKTLNTTGQDIQLCNGSASTNMVVSSYYPFTLPYYFQTSNSLGSAGLSKTSSISGSFSRGVVIENNGAGLYYSLGQITVDGVPVNFIQMNEAVGKYPSGNPKRYDVVKSKDRKNATLDTVNKVMVSEPFEISENSKISFSEYSGVADSSAAVSLFAKKGLVSFTMRLVDDATGKMLGTVKESKFSGNALSAYKTLSYVLNPKDIQGKKIRIEVTLLTDIENPELTLINQFTDADEMSELNKTTTPQELTLKTSNVITKYALEQNYPNPFNPTTTIHYQIPNAGHVTLKVYDMLGREVATLVDEVKGVGSYSATFNGEKLASGVYIMRLVAWFEEGKSFVQTKKMLLTK
jgi:hypothetical protein